MNTLRSAACAALVVTSSALAAGTLTLPPVVVHGAPDDAVATQPGIKSATERLKQVPGGANVVDAETFRENRASTLTDALRYSPGVFVQPRFGAEEARISIRGSGIQRTFHLRGIRLLQDGIPVNLADGSGDFQVIEPLAAHYIEVYRGDYFASYSTFDQEGFRRHAAQSTQRFFGHTGLRVNPDVETQFYASYVNTVSELPGALSKAQLAADPRQANAGNVAGNQKRDFDLWRFANRTAVRFDAGSRNGRL